MANTPQYTVEDVAAHRSKNDLWVVIHGKVYDITHYVRDHPGGADVLCDVAGTDATAAYEDVGHSEDADDILKTYIIGTVKGAREFTRPKAVRVIQQEPRPAEVAQAKSPVFGTFGIGAGSVGGAALLLFLVLRGHVNLHGCYEGLSQKLAIWTREAPLPRIGFARGGFSGGFLTATSLFAAIGGIIATNASKLTQIQSGFTRYPAHLKVNKVMTADPHAAKGFLDPKEFKELPLVTKQSLSSDVYRFVFRLSSPREIIGLPIGQHVAIKAAIDGQSVSRSYTPTSNNLDPGVLELVIKCYPDGLLTGKYLASLKVGDKVLFRGPKGAMKYRKGMCQRIGMIAGGTGITPMYQLIRAICEDDSDTTEVSLVYANRTEEDILLRQELDTFARNYPKNFKVWYMLDHPPKKWTYGAGYVTQQVMAEKIPSPSADTKVMLCGPPGMVNASKKALVSLGFQAPGAVSKMMDQIFCF